MQKRKLIEVSLPLEAINRESSRENYIYRGNPSSVHKWWAQRPLAAARAVLFAQLVDDPSAHPSEFPTDEMQRRERDRLHELIERLVVWENAGDETLLAQANAEILKSTNGNPPPILDPFAGGGTIPLEAQRLGLEAHASDLNPVAVLINKALVEIPPEFANRHPVFPGLADTRGDWRGIEGLAADVGAYGRWMSDEAQKKIGHCYPPACSPDGTTVPVIAWLWARTVTCPNPACGIEMPLVRSWVVGKKKGNAAYVIPKVIPDPTAPTGRRVDFVVSAERNAPLPGSVSRTQAKCISCGSATDLSYVRAEGRAGRMGMRMIACVADTPRRRTYLTVRDRDVEAAEVKRSIDAPSDALPDQALGFRIQAYGMTTWGSLFTGRQLLALCTFSDLVGDARALAITHGATQPYADAIATYLAFALSKLADYGNSLAVWYPQEDRPKNLFAMHTIPMVWDFPEVNPFSGVGGSWERSVDVVCQSIEGLRGGQRSVVSQCSAASRPYAGFAVSTDPPYYDNIDYSDLSDFFYVWLRKSLRSIYPSLLSTVLVPKADELVANPFRHGGQENAEMFFESGFRETFAGIRREARDDVPMTVYYAYKQDDSSQDERASSGWETLLEGMIKSGWEITATWPLRSERGGRSREIKSNALASSIVLSLRPRPDSAPTIDRRGFIAVLEAELPVALRRLEQGQVAPVDLPQAAIGPGMAVFSRYAGILEPDGKKMTVRSALERINGILDQVLNEQEGDFDATTRFAIAWYRQHGYSVGKFGDADNLARARNTRVDLLDRDGILMSRAGNVQLLNPADLPTDYDVSVDRHTSTWEALHHLVRVLEGDGIAPAGEFLQAALARPDGAVDADLVKELAHLLFRIAEGNNATKDALSFNALVTSWPEIMDVARTERPATLASQSAFTFDGEDV